jgi:putative nucleotidyltransferase with HDIG domain
MPTLTEPQVRDVVCSLPHVSTLPASIARIMAVTQDSSSSALELAEEISKDPALTMQVLRTVNSAYYGFQRRVQTVVDAVVLLGFVEVERIALAVSVINVFGAQWGKARALSQLWRHSLAVSIASETLVSVYHVEAPTAAGAHVAGLLHDIGKAALWQAFPKESTAAAQLSEREQISSVEAERRILGGVSHCEAGAWLSERWCLPQHIAEAIQYHHEPDAAGPENPVVDVVHLANCACYDLQLPANALEAGHPGWSETAEMRIGADERLLEEVQARLRAKKSIMSATVA